MHAADLPAVWTELEAMPVSDHRPVDGAGVISLAVDLERRSAFDAAYVALARQLHGEAVDAGWAACPQRRQMRLPVSLIDS